MESMDVSLPQDFDENINKCVLLTGAGFSKDFGGLLAEDVLEYIFNTLAVDSEIRKLIVENDGNYEALYAKLHPAAQIDYIDKLKKSFLLMDKKILRLEHISGLDRFIKLFDLANKYNFIFTTNQDLLIERYYLSLCKNRKSTSEDHTSFPDIASEIQLNFPFTDFNMTSIARDTSNKCYQGGDQAANYSYDKFLKTIAIDINNIPKINIMNYIKMHGSFNWKHSDGYIINITGNDKHSEIISSKILNNTLHLFTEILGKNTLKIVIVGYSFNDPHINHALYKSICIGSSLIIISPTKWSEFKDSKFLQNSDPERKINSNKFISGVIKYYNTSLKDFINDDFSGFKSWRFSNLEEYLK